MKQLTSILLSLITLISILSSCKKDSAIPPDPYFRHYFPASVGSYIVYDCDSIVYNDFTGEVDTFRFQIKELFESAYTDNAGREAIRLERWKKESDTTAWYLKDVWSVVKTENQIEKIEEDVRLIKLIFPVKDGREWNLNALNSLGNQTVELKDVHNPYSTTSLDFDSCVTVTNTDPANLVSEYRTTEIFAVNTGMIYKRLVDVKYVIPTPVIKSGVVFTMRATEVNIN